MIWGSMSVSEYSKDTKLLVSGVVSEARRCGERSVTSAGARGSKPGFLRGHGGMARQPWQCGHWYEDWRGWKVRQGAGETWFVRGVVLP